MNMYEHVWTCSYMPEPVWTCTKLYEQDAFKVKLPILWFMQNLRGGVWYLWIFSIHSKYCIKFILFQAQCRVTCTGLICRVCKRVYFKYAQGVVIPLTSIADPLKEFEATDVNQNIFRFLIFIMWLKHQPQACKWFLTIRKHYPDFVEACISKLMTLWRNQKPPSFWHLIASHVNRVV